SVQARAFGTSRCRRCNAPGATSKPWMRWPASARWRAIGTPITPRPIKPIVNADEGRGTLMAKLQASRRPTGRTPRSRLRRSAGGAPERGRRPPGGFGGETSRQRAPDQDLLHFACAFVDLAHAHVAVDALDREVAHVAVTAEHLDRRRADALGHLARVELGHRRFL